MDRNVETLIVDNCVCNDESFTSMDLSSFVSLKRLEVGDYSCSFVKTVELIGLNQLERVMIGKNTFSKWDRDDENPNCHFYLKNCKRLRELKIGLRSFEDYSVCEIENVPSLEVIEMGELNKDSFNFKYASLELRSDSERIELMNRLAQFEITFVWS